MIIYICQYSDIEIEWTKVVELEHDLGSKTQKTKRERDREREVPDYVSVTAVVRWAKNTGGIQPSGVKCPNEGENKQNSKAALVMEKTTCLEVCSSEGQDNVGLVAPIWKD